MKMSALGVYGKRHKPEPISANFRPILLKIDPTTSSWMGWDGMGSSITFQATSYYNRRNPFSVSVKNGMK
jgi:hypothetical protein